jgi:hypothetical protein
VVEMEIEVISEGKLPPRTGFRKRTIIIIAIAGIIYALILAIVLWITTQTVVTNP